MTENSKKMVKEERKNPKNQKKIREHFVFSNMLRLFLAGILYCILMLVSDIRIPCIFYKITGVQCPGCGMSRAILALMHGKWKQAFYYNRLSITLLPVLLLYLLYRSKKYIDDGRVNFHLWEIVFLLCSFIVTIGYGVTRNMA